MEFVRRKEDAKVLVMPNHHGGPGELYSLNRYDLKGTKGGMVIRNLYYKGSGTIPHDHTKDNFVEHYWIISGEGEFTLNDQTVTVHAGDICFMNSPSDMHALVNNNYEPLEFFSIVEFM